MRDDRSPGLHYPPRTIAVNKTFDKMPAAALEQLVDVRLALAVREVIRAVHAPEPERLALLAAGRSWYCKALILASALDMAVYTAHEWPPFLTWAAYLGDAERLLGRCSGAVW